ncbi:MAG TPA: Hsp70 family protein [Acidimicrobiales bacterium]
MGYYLGIDLGTTYTAAAVWRDGRVEIANLGTRAPVVPSVVLLRDDGTILTGEAAERRAVTEPQRVAREFKRRVGDPTPIIVGGTPYSADSLTARLLRAVVDIVVEREGEDPSGVVVSHPANWGPFKQDLLRQALRIADLTEAATITEPEAAAIHYASQERVEPGSIVAVYDLGGGTFDAAVLRRDVTGWEIMGEPEGIERLGGVDFDQAVFHHVQTAVGDAIERLDPDDPAAVAALARLRRDCVEAKEALATDVDVVIPVLLPTIQTDVRLTRSEFEDMIRPTLVDSIGALRRALRSAKVEPADVARVLLVGGSSRIPLVAQLVGSELGRPVAVDAHPKHGVALGAAIIAAEHAAGHSVHTQVVPAVDATPPASTADAPGTGAPGLGAAGVAGAAAGGAAGLAAAGLAGGGAGADTAPVDPTPASAAATPTATPASGETAAAAAGPPPGPAGSAHLGGQAAGAGAPPPYPGGAGAGGSGPATAPYGAPTARQGVAGSPGGPATGRVVVPAPGGAPGSGPRPAPRTRSGSGSDGGGRRLGLLIAAAVVVVVAGIGAAVALTGDDDDGGNAVESAGPGTTLPPGDGGPEEAVGPTDTTAPPETTTPVAQGPTVTIDDVTLQGDRYAVAYTLSGYEPADAPGALHTHFFFDTTEPDNAGTNGTPPGTWQLTYESSYLVLDWGPADAAGATQLCAVVADHQHGVHERGSGNYSCKELPA